MDPIKERGIGSHSQNRSGVEIEAATDDYFANPAHGHDAKALAWVQDCIPLHIAKNHLWSEPERDRIELLLIRLTLLAHKH